MNWEVLVIPLIALGVWVVTSIFRVAEEQQKARPQRPADGPEGRKPRRQKTDLDRFLEDARARRQAPRPAPRPAPAEAPPPRRAAAAVLEALPVAEPFPLTLSREQPARPPVGELRRPAPPVAQPVRQQPAAPPTAAVGAERAPTQNPQGEAAAAMVVIVPPTQPVGPPPSVVKLKELLTNRQNLGAALMLGEVFGPPLCKRRRRGG